MPTYFSIATFSLALTSSIVAQIESVKEAGDALQSWTANNGLAVVLLFIAIAAACYATVRVTRWTGNNLLVPLKDAAISHLRRNEETMTSISESMQEMSQQMRDMALDQARLLKCHEDLTGKIYCRLKPPGSGDWQIPAGQVYPQGQPAPQHQHPQAHYPAQGQPPAPQQRPSL